MGQGSFDGQDFSVNYDKSAISEARLLEYKMEEVAAGTTLVGPHRDDFIVNKERELSRYGSRGEQRMGVLWMKMAELKFIKERSGEMPTLLLDDVFSELDEKHREVVLKISGEQQTIITTAEPEYVSGISKIEKISLD
jgi:DNA replication and repair protein RecF